jgi:hypothetical protein
MRRTPTLHRDLFWLCQRHVNKPDTAVGQAAIRLLSADVHDAQWHADLKVVLDATWVLSPFGFYTSSLRAQGAALRIQQRLKESA